MYDLSDLTKFLVIPIPVIALLVMLAAISLILKYLPICVPVNKAGAH